MHLSRAIIIDHLDNLALYIESSLLDHYVLWFYKVFLPGIISTTEKNVSVNFTRKKLK